MGCQEENYWYQGLTGTFTSTSARSIIVVTEQVDIDKRNLCAYTGIISEEPAYARRRAHRRAALNKNLLVDIGTAAATLAISKDSVRRMIARRELSAIRLGRSVRLPYAEVERIASEGSGKYARGSR